jgi:hypothetical protein
MRECGAKSGPTGLSLSTDAQPPGQYDIPVFVGNNTNFEQAQTYAHELEGMS